MMDRQPNTGKNGGKWIILALLSVSLLFIHGNAFAHAPSNIDLVYDDAEQTLEVTVTHSVNDPADHFVERMEVTKNGEVVIDEDYGEQPSNSTFSYSYDVQAGPGDTLQATAYCNRFGDLTGTLEISEDDGGTGNGNGGTPWMLIGGAIVAVIVIIGIIVGYSRR